MKRILWKLLPLSLPIFLYSCAAPPYKSAYETAMKANNFEEAFRILKEVCDKNPAESLCADLGSVSKNYARVRYDKLKAVLGGVERPVPLPRLDEFSREAKKIKELNPALDTDAVVDMIAKEAAATDASVKDTLRAASEQRAERKKAYDLYKAAYSLDPKTRDKLDDFAAAAVKEAYTEGVKADESEDWMGARKAFEDAYYINPGYQDVKVRYEKAKAKDSYDYYIAEAGNSAKEENYDRALRLYKYALAYNDSPETRALLASSRIAAVNSVFAKGVEYIDSERPLAAGAAFLKGINILADVPADKKSGIKTPSKEIGRLLDELYVRGKREWDAGNKGMAFLYLKTVADIQPGYPDIITLKERLKDDIRRRGLQSLAVIPSKGPSYNVDAGGAITSSILNFLYRDLSNDVRILERGAIEALLKESEVKTLQGGEGSKGFLQLLGADYLLLSDVVDYKVESNVYDTYKTVRAKTGVKTIPNPRYEAWQKKKGDEPQPPAFIEEPVLEDVKYKLTHYKKTAIVTVSYRLVDAKGDVIYTGIAEKKEGAEDEATDGIDLGELKIPTRIANIPTDTEILKLAQASVIDKIGVDLKKMFSNPEDKLVKEVDGLRKAGNYKPAIERLIDARFIMERKGKDTTAVNEKLNVVVDEGRF